MARVVSVETMRQSDAYTIANLVPSKELMYRAGRDIFETVDKYKQEKCEKALDGRDVCEDMIAASGMGSCRRWYLSCPYGCAQNNTGWREPVAIAAGKGNNAGDGYVVARLLCDRGIDVELLLLEEKFSEDGKYYYDECMEAGIPVKMYEPGTFIVAADINSGLNGDTGEGSLFVKSDLTVSIGDFKFGHFIGLADEAMKDKVNVDIGIEIIGEVEDF